MPEGRKADNIVPKTGTGTTIAEHFSMFSFLNRCSSVLKQRPSEGDDNLRNNASFFNDTSAAASSRPSKAE